MNVEFQVLGPVRVVIDGSPLTIASSNQRVVLAMLLLEAGRAVPVSRLVDAVWDDSPPSTARNQVQLCISQIRKRFAGAGAGEVVITDPAGYLIPDLGESFDFLRFQKHIRLAAEAADRHPGEAIEHYRAGLKLWYGDAVADVASRIVQPAAVRLNENRLVAQEKCLDLELRLGRHAPVVGELTELVARYPLRDRFRAQLMVSLYRSGRQAEALEVFRAGRELKREELGLDPGSELRDLEEAILAGDRALDLPEQSTSRIVLSDPRPESQGTEALAEPSAETVPVPQQLPPAVAGFGGRQDLLGRIRRVLMPPAGNGQDLVRVVVLTGRGGTGKTALALHAAHAVRDAFPDGQLYAEFRDEEGPARNPGRVLGGMLRAFGIASAAVPDDVADKAAMYRSWLAGKRMLIVLDNIADTSEVEALLPGTSGCAVIITSRGRTVWLPGAHRIEVGPLDERAGVDLVSWLIGAQRAEAEPDAVKSLVLLCGGLPLALRVTGSKLAERPHWTVEQMRSRLADEARRLDELNLAGTSVRATLAFSYRSLTGGLRRLLTRLSMLGTTDFASWVAASVMSVDLNAAEDMLAELVSGQLLEARTVAGALVRYRMHDLVLIYAQEALAQEDLASERRAVLQRYLGCCLALAEKARGLLTGSGLEVLHGSAPRWHLPERETEIVLADPARWFSDEQDNLRRAALLAARTGLDETCWDLTLTASILFESAGYSDAWRETQEAALRAAEDAGNRLGVAAMLYSLGDVTLRYDLAESVSYLRRALRVFGEVGSVHGQGLALRDLALVDRQAGRYTDAKRRCEEALEYLRAVGDLAGQASVLRNLARIETDRANYSTAQDMLLQSIALGQGAGTQRTSVQSQARYQLADLYHRRGDPERARRLLVSVLGDVRESKDLLGEAYCQLCLGQVLDGSGDIQGALAELRAAKRLADQTADVAACGETRLALAVVEFKVGHVERAAVLVGEALGLFGKLGSALWRARCLELAGRLHTRAGHIEEAIRTWREAADLAGDADAALVWRLQNHLRERAPG